MGGKPRIPRCKGHGYHVFALGADRCSLCGWNRYPSSPKPKRIDVLVTLENPYEELGLYAVLVRNVESHGEAEETARTELSGEDWIFRGSATVTPCGECGGPRYAAKVYGSGHVTPTHVLD